MDFPSAAEVLDHLAAIEQELLRERQEKQELETKLNTPRATMMGLMVGLSSPICTSSK